MPPKRGSLAFTLIELLVVVAIIGLIATLAAVGLSDARAKGRDEKRVTDLKQIQKALELTFQPSAGYPVVAGPTVIGGATTDVLCAKGQVAAFVPDATVSNCDADKIFMGLVPANPTPNGADYTYRSTDGISAACTAGPCLGFCVQATLEKAITASGLEAGPVIVDQSSFRNGTCP